jgi:hypothetical protein
MSIAMRYMLIQTFGREDETTVPITEWSPEDIAAHIEFQQALNDELTRLGELVGAEGLASPEVAKFVVWDGRGEPIVTDGPYTEFKELIAGYRLIDVDTIERAIEIAARISAAPGAGGAPIRHPIEVRQILSLDSGNG